MPSVRALREGDERVWRDFFARYDALIRSVAAWPRWHFDAHTCEDVVQGIRVAVVRSVGRLESEGSLEAFVKRICVNRCIDQLRKVLREQGRLSPLGFWDEDGEWGEADVAAGESYDPVWAIQRAERAETARAALARLEPGCQGLIRQFYGDGLSYREIAEREGVAVNTVGSRLSRCLGRLREALEAEGRGG